jgi:diazepam-binding inhibitor (GABA receptor modulating acyl-CoA-binding protein)
MDFADSDAFENAAAAARSDLGGVSPDEQLELYGLYKQSVEGDCVSAKPAIWDMTARAKWHAWQAQVGLGKKDAQELYVQLVAALLATPGSSAAQVRAARRCRARRSRALCRVAGCSVADGARRARASAALSRSRLSARWTATARRPLRGAPVTTSSTRRARASSTTSTPRFRRRR